MDDLVLPRYTVATGDHVLHKSVERCIFKKTVETVTACGGHLLCQLKANQPRLHQALRKHASQRPAADSA